ncbi:MAG: sensor histidine kinase [bacterium]
MDNDQSWFQYSKGNQTKDSKEEASNKVSFLFGELSTNEPMEETVEKKIQDCLEQMPDFLDPYFAKLDTYSTHLLKWITNPQSQNPPPLKSLKSLVPITLKNFPADISNHLYPWVLNRTSLKQLQEKIAASESIIEALRRSLLELLKENNGEKQPLSSKVEPAANELKTLRKKNNNLQQLVKTKETIIRETHHRAKNNLQVVLSLLKLKRRKSEKSPEEILDQIVHTLENMMSIHEKLQSDEGFQKRKLHLKSYIMDLSQSLVQTFSPDSQAVDLELDVDDITISMHEIVPIGLILNELILNTIQHFDGQSDEAGPLEIPIKLTASKKDAQLRVRDNGSGVSPGDSGKDKASYGLEIVRQLAENQLDGSFRQDLNQPGTEWTINFPLSSTMEAPPKLEPRRNTGRPIINKPLFEFPVVTNRSPSVQIKKKHPED